MEMPTMEQLKRAAGEIAKKHDLKFVALYGSLAKGTAKDDSDVDIAVLGQAPLSFGDIVAMINEFMDELKINEIDVKSLHRTDPFFRWEVMEAAVLLHGDEFEFQKFKTYAFRDFVESQSLLKLKETLVKKRLQNL